MGNQRNAKHRRKIGSHNKKRSIVQGSTDKLSLDSGNYVSEFGPHFVASNFSLIERDKLLIVKIWLGCSTLFSMGKSRKRMRTGRLNAQKAPQVIKANSSRKCNGDNENSIAEDDNQNQPYLSDQVGILG